MLAGSHLQKSLFSFFFFRWTIWKGTTLLANMFFPPEDHNIFIQHFGFPCTLECVFMSKITAQFLITLLDFTIIAAVPDLPNTMLHQSPVQESPTMTEPAEHSCEGVLERTWAWTRGRIKSQRPDALGTVRRRVKWKVTYWIENQIPCLASVLRLTCLALCATGHSNGWAEICSTPRTEEVLSSSKMLYEAHGVFFCQPQAQHRFL